MFSQLDLKMNVTCADMNFTHHLINVVHLPLNFKIPKMHMNAISAFDKLFYSPQMIATVDSTKYTTFVLTTK